MKKIPSQGKYRIDPFYYISYRITALRVEMVPVEMDVQVTSENTEHVIEEGQDYYMD